MESFSNDPNASKILDDSNASKISNAINGY